MKADHEKQTLSVDAAANAEELDFKLKLAAKRFKPLDASFDLSSQRMNIDRYPFLLGGASGAKNCEPRTGTFNTWPSFSQTPCAFFA